MIWTLQSGGDHWISGLYKIERYESSIADRLGVHYRAYVKPKGWTHWGNYVEARTPYYPSLKAAQAACARHERALFTLVVPDPASGGVIR